MTPGRGGDDNGVPVILVHGLVVSSRYMIPTAERLAGERRVYAPDLGAFLSADPVLFADSMANAYRYAFGNPLSFSDPSGRASWTDLFASPKDIVMGAATAFLSQPVVRKWLREGFHELKHMLYQL